MTNYSAKVTGYREVTGVLELESQPPPASTVQYYMQKEDRDVFGSVRSCAPCPAIFVMKDDPHAKIGQQWQYAVFAANFHMTLMNVFLLFDDHLAFANRTGFQSFNTPGRADYFFNRSLTLKPPQLDKVRTTSRSVMTGVEEYSAVQALKDALEVVKSVMTRQVRSFALTRQAFRTAVAAETNVLTVKVFDSRSLPRLKPGKTYPNDISEVDPDNYLDMPWDAPEMWMVANVVRNNGEVYQFPRGAVYSWWGGGVEPVSFMPHIADLGYGLVKYAMRNLTKLPLGSGVPRNYTIPLG